MNVLLQGVVGSTAYGLAHAGSDIDRLGVYAEPAVAFHGLTLPIDRAASIVHHDPDITLHEARKYCLLALAANPTVMDLLWLPSYEVSTDLGVALVAIRTAFLSAPRVRDAYLGYASQQLRRLSTGSTPAAKLAKHARHLARLLHQGRDLYRTGHLRVRLEDPQWYVDFGQRIASDVTVAADLLASVEASYDGLASPLPEVPDTARVEAWLLSVRAALPV